MIGIFLGLSLFLVCGIYFCTRRSDVRNLNLYHWFVLGIGIFYGLFFAINVYLLGEGYFTESSQWVTRSEDYYFIYYVLIYAFIIFSYFGYITPKTKVKSDAYLNSSDNKDKAYFLIIILLLTLSCLFIYLFTKGRGGVIGNIHYSKAFGEAKFTESNSWSFLNPLITLAPVSCVLLYSYFLFKKNTINLIAFIFSLLPAYYVLFFNSGRLTLILFSAAPLLVYALYKEYRNATVFFAIVVGVFLLISSVSYISDLLDWKSRGNYGQFFISETSFPFYGFFANVHANTDSIRLFKDILMYPFYVLPERVTGITFDVTTINTASVENVEFYSSYKEASKPVDLITFGWLQGGVLGVALFGYFYGYILKVINNTLQQISYAPIKLAIFGLIVIRMMYGSFYYMAPMGFFNKNIAIIFSIFVVYLVARKEIKSI